MAEKVWIIFRPGRSRSRSNQSILNGSRNASTSRLLNTVSRKFHFVAQKWIRGLYNENITVPFGDRHEWRLHYKCDLAIARVVNQATRVMSPNCVVSSVDIFRVQANGAGSIITGVFVTHTVV